MVEGDNLRLSCLRYTKNLTIIHNDLTHWPLVISIARGTPTMEEVAQFQQAWSGWLARGEPFATLRLFLDSQTLEHPPGSAASVKQWLQIHALAIKERVMGMATIVPESELARVSKMNAEKLFGVPADSFSDVAVALTWLHERVYTPRGLVLDVVGVGRTIG